MISLIYLLFFLPKDTCHEKFINELLNLSQNNEYLLIIRAKENSKIISIAITNVDLSLDLNSKNQVIDKSIEEKINKGQAIINIDSSTKYFGVVKHTKLVEAVKKKGKKYFINYYFDQHHDLKDNLPKGTSLEQVIEILFNWNVFVSYSEGNLHIVKRLNCN